MITVNVTTQQLYKNFTNSNCDVLFDEPTKGDINDVIVAIEGLITGDKQQIRSAFKDFTVLLLNDHMSTIQQAYNKNEDFMIIVSHKGKPIVALLPDDVLW